MLIYSFEFIQVIALSIVLSFLGRRPTEDHYQLENLGRVLTEDHYHSENLGRGLVEDHFHSESRETDESMSYLAGSGSTGENEEEKDSKLETREGESAVGKVGDRPESQDDHQPKKNRKESFQEEIESEEVIEHSSNKKDANGNQITTNSKESDGCDGGAISDDVGVQFKSHDHSESANESCICFEDNSSIASLQPPDSNSIDLQQRYV